MDTPGMTNGGPLVTYQDGTRREDFAKRKKAIAKSKKRVISKSKGKKSHSTKGKK